MDKELDLAVTCYGKVKPLKYDLVLLPWGATEPHNLHLPYLTDCILSHDIALDAAKMAKTHYGIRCMVLPYVTAGCLSIRPRIPQNGHYQRTWRQYIQKYDT